ncbi:MAG: di-trans,poly-cis-decaprenylcistransferase [Rickettsiales bacterium]|jgi:undecaprenyl diphosphate synthase|nr:di-trans,poly-cis-decaprenylcistransferase [Rickettsiales bacterium]
MKLLSKLFPANGGGVAAKAAGVVSETIPGHIAFIMDGNGRWAQRKGLPRTAGHAAASANLEKLLEHLLDRGVHTVTMYSFSTENWSRPKQEVNFLMGLMARELKRVKKSCVEKNIRVRAIGRRDRIPTALLNAIEEIELATIENTRGTACFAIDYGGQDEVLRATQNMLADKLDPDEITPATFDEYLDTGDLTPVDLMVRTSGEQRISNFLLWKGAYAEIMFVDEMWPDLTPKILDRILAEFGTRTRRFGGLKK